MRPKLIRFVLGLSLFGFFILITTFSVRGTAAEDQTPAESCLDCGLTKYGFVDVDNSQGVAGAYIEFTSKSGQIYQNLWVAPMSRRSFYFANGTYGWKAWWFDPIFYLPHQWDWGWIDVKSGGRASIVLDPHGKPR